MLARVGAGVAFKRTRRSSLETEPPVVGYFSLIP